MMKPRGTILRKTARLVWILVPAAVLAMHFGPGQDYQARDEAGDLVRRAQVAADAGRWQEAVALFDQAESALPKESVDLRRRVAFERTRSQIRSGELLEGISRLEDMLGEPGPENARDAGFVRAVRGELASASYYAGWLLRLDGADVDQWMTETERARQQFRLLAEGAESAGTKEAETFKKNLEAAIRLEQMDLSELKGLPLPSRCKGCKNISQRQRRQRESLSRSPGGGKEEEQKDARDLIKEMPSPGAGLNAMEEGAGS